MTELEKAQKSMVHALNSGTPREKVEAIVEYAFQQGVAVGRVEDAPQEALNAVASTRKKAIDVLCFALLGPEPAPPKTRPSYLRVVK